jgi:hypothetical protein
MRRVTLVILAVSTALLVSSVLVHAAQVVRFKSGFELVALNVRYEGEMVILTLEGGSEVGFPRWALQDLERSKTGPMPQKDTYGRNRVSPESRIGKNFAPISSSEQKKIDAARGKVLASSSMNEKNSGKSVSVGYSLGGPQRRFSAGPTGPVHSSGKVGTSLKDALSRRRGIDPETGKPVARTVKPAAAAVKQ